MNLLIGFENLKYSFNLSFLDEYFPIKRAICNFMRKNLFDRKIANYSKHLTATYQSLFFKLFLKLKIDFSGKKLILYHIICLESLNIEK